jgi:serine/threonine protein kinase
MAPELRARDFPYNPFQSDIYSLGMNSFKSQGIVLMQMMTNKDIRVYQKMSSQEIAQMVRQSGQFP